MRTMRIPDRWLRALKRKRALHLPPGSGVTLSFKDNRVEFTRRLVVGSRIRSTMKVAPLTKFLRENEATDGCVKIRSGPSPVVEVATFKVKLHGWPY